MVSTATHSTPTIDVAQRTNSQGGVASPAAPNTPLIAVYPFRDGSTYRVFVLSRKLTGDTPVTLRLPFSSITGGAIYKLTGDPRATNANTLTITETQQPLGTFAQNYALTSFVNADSLAEYARLDIGAGYYGGTFSTSGGVRYWTLAVLRDPSNQANPTIDYIRSNVPVVIGQPALLVMKMTFGATDRIDLFVNPSGLGGRRARDAERGFHHQRRAGHSLPQRPFPGRPRVRFHERRNEQRPQQRLV
jgi:hypothetical protein